MASSDLISLIEKCAEGVPLQSLRDEYARLTFHLNTEFGKWGYILSREFLVELNELSGNGILPYEISDSCIIIKTYCKKSYDFQGIDYRQLFLENEEYHQLFSSYQVNSIYFHFFPKQANFESRYLLNEIGIPFQK